MLEQCFIFFSLSFYMHYYYFQLSECVDILTPALGTECVCKDIIFVCINMICNMTTFRQKKCFDLSPHRGFVQGQNMCLQGAICSIPFNLLCNMTTFSK